MHVTDAKMYLICFKPPIKQKMQSAEGYSTGIAFGYCTKFILEILSASTNVSQKLTASQYKKQWSVAIWPKKDCKAC